MLPYQQQIVAQIKARYPETPLTLCVHDSASLLHLMARSGVDVVHIDWTIPMKAARQQLGNLPVQGNLDPCILLGTPESIEQRTLDMIQQAGDRGYIVNLGQGILNITPEENVAFFFETVKQSHREIAPVN